MSCELGWRPAADRRLPAGAIGITGASVGGWQVARNAGQRGFAGYGSASWSRHGPDHGWTSVALSADGTKPAVVADGGYKAIALSASMAGVSGAADGGYNDAVSLQYVGHGVFSMIDHQGSPAVR